MKTNCCEDISKCVCENCECECVCSKDDNGKCTCEYKDCCKDNSCCN